LTIQSLSFAGNGGWGLQVATPFKPENGGMVVHSLALVTTWKDGPLSLVERRKSETNSSIGHGLIL
jgi:hypothetical protein